MSLHPLPPPPPPTDIPNPPETRRSVCAPDIPNSFTSTCPTSPSSLPLCSSSDTLGNYIFLRRNLCAHNTFCTPGPYAATAATGLIYPLLWRTPPHPAAGGRYRCQTRARFDLIIYIGTSFYIRISYYYIRLAAAATATDRLLFFIANKFPPVVCVAALDYPSPHPSVNRETATGGCKQCQKNGTSYYYSSDEEIIIYFSNVSLREK